ncbi:MAG TPA: hypothetical protein VHC67_09965 [Gaiellaceae bacterium]|jgi:hypothetical protein|nr:hypothetical protein [Gaiellaceae bacterium]
MRVSDAMAAAGIRASENGAPLHEEWFYGRCPGCGESFQLVQLPNRQTEEKTEYVCPACASVVIAVGPASSLVGYRLRDNAIDAPAGMWMRHPNGNVVEFPATGGG